MSPARWRFGGRSLALDPPLVMGILNMTPDSFSDGGDLRGVEAAVKRAEAMVAAGAAILDVGGESTRPGAPEVPVDEEIRRVVPVIRALRERVGVPVSIDTRKAAVAREALAAGAEVVNDVSGLTFDPALASVVAEHRAGLVLMHMRGTPADMAGRAVYRDLMGEVESELAGSVDRALAAGVPKEAVVLDPGIGFAKTPEQSVRILGEIGRLRRMGFPLMVGPSRKSFLGAILGVPPEERVAGTVAACVVAWMGGAEIFRVHDVRPVVEALAVARAVRQAKEAGPPSPRTEMTLT